MASYDEHQRLIEETRHKMNHARSITAKRDLRKFYNSLISDKKIYKKLRGL